MLTDWTRSVAPEYLGAISDLDQSNEWPTLNDFVDYVELRILPPGMQLPADARQELFDTLNQRIGPMLAAAMRPGRSSMPSCSRPPISAR
jgi:hypothetical protein